MPQQQNSTSAETEEKPIINGCHVLFEVEGKNYGGVIDDISPGGFGEVVGYGFIAQNVDISICTLNLQFPHPLDT